MQTLENFKLITISLLLAVGLAACNKPGPAETAGKKFDQAVDESSKKIGEAADNAGGKMAGEGSKAGVAMDDAEITAKVKAAIFNEPGLKTLQISVDTVKGVVTLSGTVDSLQSSDKAKTLAVAVSSVKEVENRLVIMPNK